MAGASTRGWACLVKPCPGWRVGGEGWGCSSTPAELYLADEKLVDPQSAALTLLKFTVTGPGSDGIGRSYQGVGGSRRGTAA